MLEVGGYDETLLRNQDNDLNQKLRARGHELFLTDEVQCRYYARSTIMELWRWGFGTGRWNAISLKRNPISLRPRHLVPLIFASSIFSLVAIALVAPPRAVHPRLLPGLSSWRVWLLAGTSYWELSPVHRLLCARKVFEGCICQL